MSLPGVQYGREDARKWSGISENSAQRADAGCRRVISTRNISKVEWEYLGILVFRPNDCTPRR